MAIGAGVDFGTFTVRVTLVDTEHGRLGSGTADYPLHRTRSDPDFATQSQDDHMCALADATRQALAKANVTGEQAAALSIDTTGSSFIPVDENLQPLNEYYLWCDHRLWRKAALITETCAERDPESQPVVIGHIWPKLREIEAFARGNA